MFLPLPAKIFINFCQCIHVQMFTKKRTVPVRHQAVMTLKLSDKQVFNNMRTCCGVTHNCYTCHINNRFFFKTDTRKVLSQKLLNLDVLPRYLHVTRKNLFNIRDEVVK
jgi:hypothetical protein